MSLFKKSYRVDYSKLIHQLEAGDDDLIDQLLWQPKNSTVDYMSVTKGLIKKLKKDEQAEAGLKVHSKHQKGRFELIILEIPWRTNEIPFSPIIIDQSNGKIVGILLPFNELSRHLSKRERKNISAIGMIWVQFALKNQFIK